MNAGHGVDADGADLDSADVDSADLDSADLDSARAPTTVPSDAAPLSSSPGTSYPSSGTDGQTRMELLETLFYRLQGAPAADRNSLLGAWCGGDRELAQELGALLAADAEVEQALSSSSPPSSPPSSSDAMLLGAPRELRDDEEPWLHLVVGGFRLVSLLGRGGMGVVYRGEPVLRTGQGESHASGSHSGPVAVKFMRQSFAGSPARSSFLRERDALAALSHPNIARLLDAGVTEDGVPFVVMEYVEGVRLDEACSVDSDVADPGAPSTTPSVEYRVGLMLQLCEAVAYVHRNLILHRDLKPGNVIVRGDGVVKLLDFGTIKIMGAQAGESDMTQAGMRPVTLRYASPEHIRGTSLTTASDAFSLGLVLYRLLAGRLPKELAELPVSGYLERLALGGIAPPLRCTPSPGHTGVQTSRALAADLNAITLKAMRFEPEARYPSAAALAEDLQRALEGRPVKARGAGRRYRLASFCQRNRGSLLTAAASLLILAGGVGMMAHELRVARAEQRRAKTGVAEESKLAHALLFDYFEQLKALPGSTGAQRQAVAEVLSYLDGLSASKAVQGSGLELDQVQAYTRMGAVQGSPYEENLGDISGAVATLDKGRRVAHQLSARQPDDLPTLEAEADADKVEAQVDFGAGNLKGAVAALEPAAAVADRIARNRGAGAPDLAIAASIFDLLGDIRGMPDTLNTGESARAAVSYRRALELHSQGLAADPANTRCRRGIAVELWKLGLVVEDDDPGSAIVFYRHGLADLATFSPAEQTNSRNRRMDTLLRQRLGMMLARTDNPREGLPMLAEVRQRFGAAIAADPIDQRARFDLAALDSNYAVALRAHGDKAQAQAVLAEYLDNIRTLRKLAPDNVDYQYFYAKGLLAFDGNTPGSAAQRAEGLALIRKLAAAPAAGANMLQLACEALLRQGLAPQEALTDIQSAIARAGADSARRQDLLQAQAAVARGPASLSH